jgi:hypothetical protein
MVEVILYSYRTGAIVNDLLVPAAFQDPKVKYAVDG